jgi:hypothetical protein
MIHVILLEDENVILFESEQHYDYQVMNECVEKNEFAKKHKPLIFLEKIPITESTNIDDHVKQYMKYYGINHVRGGSYMDISKEQYEALQKEFCNMDTLELFNSLKYFVHENVQYAIDRTTIAKIQWLMDSIQMKYYMEKYNQTYPHTIHHPLSIFFNEHGVKEYSNILILMDGISKKNIATKLQCEYSNYVKFPYKLFDNLLFSNREITYEEYSIAKSVCDYFEYLAYCIINKCDELEFDIQPYNVPDNEMLVE